MLFDRHFWLKVGCLCIAGHLFSRLLWVIVVALLGE